MTQVHERSNHVMPAWAPMAAGVLGLGALGYFAADGNESKRNLAQDRQLVERARRSLPHAVTALGPNADDATSAVRAAYEGRTAGMALYRDTDPTKPISPLISEIHPGRARTAEAALDLARGVRPRAAAVSVEHEGWHYPASLDRSLTERVTLPGGPGSFLVDPIQVAPVNDHITGVRSGSGNTIRLGGIGAARFVGIEDGSLDGRAERRLAFYHVPPTAQLEGPLEGATLERLAVQGEQDVLTQKRNVRRAGVSALLGVALLGGAAVVELQRMNSGGS